MIHWILALVASERAFVVQLKNGPFDVDLILCVRRHRAVRGRLYARRVEIEGFPACSMDDIIESKASANRVRDRESLPRLRACRDYLRQRGR